MPANIVTIEDPKIFRLFFLSDLEKIVSQRQFATARKWLKSREMRRLLTLSPGMLALPPNQMIDYNTTMTDSIGPLDMQTPEAHF